ncbi:MAG: dihydrodipicolinate synthase family protein, partial [Gemmatimonadota bacterium]|nr:dihydrodipicolinate synthase family protein [Gemmatimonadota bacterium]
MIRIDDAVITAQTLEGRLAGERQVEIGPGSKLTPSAQDLLRVQGVEIVRREVGGQVPPTPAPAPVPAPAVPRAAVRKAFEGIFCPNVVLFDSQNEINHAEMERYINWLIEIGIHGLNPNGSTGEFARLSQEERQDVVRLVCEV